MWQLTEKEWFAASFAPPLVLTWIILRLLQYDPRPLMNSIAFLIPGYMGQTYDEANGTLRLRLDGSADFWTEQLAKVQEQLGLSNAVAPQVGREVSLESLPHSPGSSRARATRDSLEIEVEGAVVEGVDLHRGHTLEGLQLHPSSPAGRKSNRVVDLYVNTKHLMWTSLFPVLFLMTYFWDQAVLKKEVSVEFPLDNCMRPDDNECFWNDRQYSIFQYPDYHLLDCQGMWNRTIHSEIIFAWKAPKEAKFYKCYEVRLAFADVLAALGDIAALFLLSGLFILRYSIAFTSMKLDVDGQRDAREKLWREKRRMYTWIAVWAVVFFLTLPLVQKCYGVYTNGYVILFLMPAVPLFFIVLLWNHLEVIDEQMKTVKEAEESEEPSLDSEDTSPSMSTTSSVNRRRYEADRRRAHKEADEGRRQPLMAV